MRINKMITLRTLLDLQTKSFNKLFKIMYEYRLRKFVFKELTPAPSTRVLFAAVRIARKDILFVQRRIPSNNRRGPFFSFQRLRRLFEGEDYLKVGRDNCFNCGVIIFRFKPAELTPFDFDYIGDAALIWGGAY